MRSLIESKDSARIADHMKTHSLDKFDLPEHIKEKGELLIRLMKFVIDPDILKQYFGRFPSYILPNVGGTPCHLLARYDYWPDVWKAKFVQRYLEDNIELIDVVDKRGKSIIESFESSRIQLYIVRSICLRKVSHYMWMALRCPTFILAKVTPNIRRYVLTYYIKG
mmetsp:Transcript_3783/g.8060  ORF Transcript_3783/g.8060 Transcript_3783/m.8060 type:complete len:166 (+) Transcript_3783:120-617(+)